MGLPRRTRVDGWPPRDRLGNKQPFRLNAISLFRALPWAVKMFATSVPETYWGTYLDPEDDEYVAIVACGCGETVWTGGARPEECACGRFFLFLGDDVRCFKPSSEGEAADRGDS